MSKMNFIPDLRFPEFASDGTWEEGFVEEFFSVGSSKRVLQEDWTSNGVPFYRTRELVSLSKKEPFGSEIFISEDLFLEISEKYGIPTEGDFLVSGVGTLGISYQVKAGDRFYFKDGNVLWFKLEKGIDSTYFKFCFQSDYIQNQIVKQTSISTVGTYTIQNAKKTKLWYPPKPQEQQKIASCLSSLDEVIAAHSQKLELLKDHKKGLMQNLFPCPEPVEGRKTNVPKIRFKEFEKDGEWEIKELNQLGDLINGLTYSPSDVMEKGLLVLRSSNIQDGLIDLNDCVYVREDIKGVNLTEPNDILVCVRNGSKNLIGKNAIIPKGIPYATHGAFMTVFRAKHPEFVFQLFQTEYYDKQVKADLGATINSINGKNFLKYEFPVPENPKEQQKIASCLSSLDALISAQAEKIEQLQQHKKGLMQGLFPKIEN